VRATDELIGEYKDRGFLFTTVPAMMQMGSRVNVPCGTAAR
jgi:hypothetical protein